MAFLYRSYFLPIIRLAYPAMIESFFLSVAGIVDMLFVARLGLVQVAAVGVAFTILQVYLALFLALGTASSVLVSRTIGTGHQNRVKSLIPQSIYLATGTGITLGIVSLIFARPMLELIGAKGETLDGSVLYFQIVAAFSAIMALFTVLGSLLRGAGDTKSPLRSGLWMNGIHLVLDYVFIFGVGDFQGLGLKGAAIATVLARAIGVGFLVLFLYQKHKDLIPVKKIEWARRYSIQKRIIRLGFPAALERLFKRFGQIVYFSMIVRMGALVFAAHRLAGNFTIIPDVIGTGFAVAASTLIGMQLGSGNPKRAGKYASTSLLLTIFSMTCVLFVLFLFAGRGAKLFTDNEFVIRQIKWVLGIDVIAQPATAVVLILTAALQAGGDTKFPMITTGIGIWLFRTLGAFFFGIYLGWGLPGVWASIALDNYFRAAVLLWRYRKGKWVRAV